MRILIVDDQELNRKLLRVVLRAEGHEVVEAIDGLEALDRLKAVEVEAVVSDILMPNLDGYALCRAVRNDPRWSHLPFVIYTSTYVSPGDKEFALECGADLYLRKPAPSQELLETIDAAIAKRRAAGDSSGSVVEETFLKKYNEVLIHKLEEKNVELQKLTEDLRASEEMFRGLVENLKQVFFLTGPDGRPVQYVSPAYETVWGRSCESLYLEPRSWLEAVLPGDRYLLDKIFEEPIRETLIEFRISTPAGETKWIGMTISAVTDSQGALAGIRGLAGDLTPQKQAELQFHQAQKMEGIGRLAGGVAHDFNNLLTAIVGFNSLALMKIAEGHPALPHLNQIDGLVRRAARLTQQLLAFSRRQMFEPQIIDLNELLSGMEKMLGPLIGETISLVVVKDPELGTVRVDPGQMEQVVVNLCVNAKDAMAKGGQITIVTRNTVLESKPAVQVSVSDTGTGIEPEVLSKIFEPFFTTKDLGRGTGLGLATCYGIIKQSGGQILVDSVVGQGTTFQVLFPRADNNAEARKIATVPTTTTNGTETLLVIEDDQDVSQATAGLLREMRYTVLVARNSDEALDHIANDTEKSIRLVLTDVVMPGLNGKELADQILAKRPELRVIFASGYTDDAILLQGIEESEVDFLRKPFTPYALSAKIREVLDRAK